MSVAVSVPQTFPLRYTPRRLSVHPETRRLAIIETDHNAFNASEKAKLRQLAEGGDVDAAAGAGAGAGAAAAEPDDDAMDEDDMQIEDGAAAGAGAAAGGARAGAGGPADVDYGAIPEEDEAVEEEGAESRAAYHRRVGPPIPAVSGKWASCIRVFDPQMVSGTPPCVREVPSLREAFACEMSVRSVVWLL